MSTLFDDVPRKLVTGGIALVVGLFIATTAFEPPPALDKLLQVEQTVNGGMRTVGPVKGTPAHVAVPFNNFSGEVRYVCGGWRGCVIPERLYPLQPGGRVRVWLQDRVIWQLEYQGKLLIDYADVRAEYLRSNHQSLGVALLIILAGIVLIVWGLRPEPRELEYFSQRS